MVDHLYLQDATSFDHSVGEFSILRTRLGVTGRVVVREHDRGCVGSDSRSKDLARLHGYMCNGTNCNCFDGDKAEMVVQK